MASKYKVLIDVTSLEKFYALQPQASFWLPQFAKPLKWQAWMTKLINKA